MDQGIEIEARILAAIRRKVNYYKYRRILQDSFFQSVATRNIFTFIDEVFSAGNTEVGKLTVAHLKTITHQKVKNKEQRLETIRLLNDLKQYSTKDDSVMENAIKDFVKRQLVKMSVLKSLEELDKPNPDFNEIHDTISKAVSINTDGERDYYHYFEDTIDRINPENEEAKISTGIPQLDELLDGGSSAGDLIVILAPPERGKTLVLVNLAVAALYQGLTVGYLTMELAERKIARRFDLRISGRSIDLLRSDPLRIKNPLASLRKNGCDLVIKDYSSEAPKIPDLKSFIINYQNRVKKNFDLLVVDYADLITPTSKHNQERFGIKEVYTNLRRLANEFKIPVITASQANRKAVGKTVITMEDFAEDFQKAAVADVVIALCQSPEELEEDLARLYIAKNRSTGQHKLFRVMMKPRVMYIGGYKKGD